VSALRPLPGIRFEAQPRPAASLFPRMDVALFAGFAATGPVHVPVAVEDPAQFAAVFGDDAALARDADGGTRYAYLAPAVRAFFRNGGRRCWIVRLAGRGAARNRFRIPGLFTDGQAAAYAVARAVGSWSDAVRVSTNLVRHPVRLSALHLDKPIRIEANVDAVDEIVAGDLLRLTWGTEALFLFAGAVHVKSATVEIIAERSVWLPQSSPPTGSLPDGPVAERLLFDLRAGSERIAGLGFAPRHPRYWGTLPDDEALYTSLSRSDSEWPPVWKAALHPRFSLAAETSSSFFLPIGMGALPAEETAAEHDGRAALERDGLDPFDRDLFLDPRLARSDVRDLLATADFLRYQTNEPKPLSGIHAALPVDEATIFAVPDAVHRGWTPGEGAIVTTTAAVVTPSGQRGTFVDCTLIDSVDAPALSCSVLQEGSSFTLLWTPFPGAIDVVEEATRNDFSDAVVIDDSGSAGTLLLTRAGGTFHYRLRRHIGARVSPYSNSVAVRVSAGAGYTAIDDGQPPLLAEVHAAMLRMCAARGDFFALLALPLGTREEDAIARVTALQHAVEAQTFSYGAVVHPWLIGREENDVQTLRTNPPDGAIAGVMAARAAARGAWVAPANEPLLGVVALAPPMRAALLQALQDARINVVRHEPAGFVCLDSDTLSGDDDLRPINVRRLLILIRRAALDVGSTYVFEPNDGALRRAVKRALESMLETMFTRGAFAGKISRTAFQVSTGDSVNTRNDADNGRFIAEVRVAPSRPLSFLTIRLLQSGDRTVAQEVR
jgi:hypothetical protein